MRETLHNNAGWVCFRILILPEIFKSQKRFEEDVLCMYGSYTFAPARWTCKKQISVSHSSNKSEIMSLDARLRIDGIPALKLWYFWSLFCEIQREYRESCRVIQFYFLFACVCPPTVRFANWLWESRQRRDCESLRLSGVAMWAQMPVALFPSSRPSMPRDKNILKYWVMQTHEVMNEISGMTIDDKPLTHERDRPLRICRLAAGTAKCRQSTWRSVCNEPRKRWRSSRTVFRRTCDTSTTQARGFLR